ncbi:hypothetical protein GCM10010387_46150 [Streptomyces inusitatus]|uniref:Uncharacterized protein n=1 Tax=Streptomyces inusitatus TaxID=68221 RepID=A0A918QIC1_9ACTN|nr:hypothetical protein [Streptomyces inusitatus]GGZ46474.1 hypothetical protein GCM10010387_46150 [Streptomyces inusitatus]
MSIDGFTPWPDELFLRYRAGTTPDAPRGGENVAAGEPEEHPLTHPAIAEVCVLALPEETLGEEVRTVVVLAPYAERAPGPRS